MPMGSVVLKPGVNTQYTPSLNEAGVSEANLIRYKDQLIQKLGGWEKYYPLTIDSTIREIWGWQTADAIGYLAVGATASLNIITAGSLSNITPQRRTQDVPVALTTTAGSCLVTVTATGSSVSTNDAVFFNTPISVGGLVIRNGYQINTILGTSGFTFYADALASSSVTSSGRLPIFDTTAGSAIVNVTFPNNDTLPIQGLLYGYYAPTSVGGLTIQGRYQTLSIIDSTLYTIGSLTEASCTATATMNSSLMELVYYIAIGPPQAGSGYGLGGYGLGGYGLGATVSGGAGTPITSTDWSMTNWGEILLACPGDGAVYEWAPNRGFSTAAVVASAPFFNGGIYISQPQQILVCWKSVQSTGVQDPLVVRWSDAGDFTQWTVTSLTAAGSFHIPSGSVLRGGLQAPNYGVVWTDVDVWIQQYVGGDVTFNHTRVGSGCGLIGQHAAGVIAGQVYWCGASNFFILGQAGVQVLPCSVWDFIFQNMDLANVDKVRCAPNSVFNEISWYFPSAGGTGENDSYVKYNILEQAWDYGSLNRNAWIDITALGNPIGADTTSLYQHEMTNNGDGAPIQARFESGFWTIADGNEMPFVDWFLPDMKFGTFGSTMSASVDITFQSADYPGAPIRTYGPYTFTSTTEYLTPRVRGRLMSLIIESNDTDSFWRVGRCRYRYGSAGRR